MGNTYNDWQLVLEDPYDALFRSEEFLLIMEYPDYGAANLLTKAISDAHKRTCLVPIEEAQELFRKAQVLNRAQLLDFTKQMSQEQLWQQYAKNLAMFIQLFVEFARMVPGFRMLDLDDRIHLLKASSFELGVLRMSRFYDLQTNCVLEGNLMLPKEAFFTLDTAELNFIPCLFELAKSIAELKLTDTELALYSAAVLLNPDRQQGREHGVLRRIYDAVLRALRFELERTRTAEANVALFDTLIAKLPQLRNVSQLHMVALAKIRQTHPHLQFPELYREMFIIDT